MLEQFFKPSNLLLSSILCAVAIVIYFLLNWLIKKLFKQNTRKGFAVLNLFLNITWLLVLLVSQSLYFVLCFPRE